MLSQLITVLHPRQRLDISQNQYSTSDVVTVCLQASELLRSARPFIDERSYSLEEALVPRSLLELGGASACAPAVVRAAAIGAVVYFRVALSMRRRDFELDDALLLPSLSPPLLCCSVLPAIDGAEEDTCGYGFAGTFCSEPEAYMDAPSVLKDIVASCRLCGAMRQDLMGACRAHVDPRARQWLAGILRLKGWTLAKEDVLPPKTNTASRLDDPD